LAGAFACASSAIATFAGIFFAAALAVAVLAIVLLHRLTI
jgi:hypothetical protein